MRRFACLLMVSALTWAVPRTGLAGEADIIADIATFRNLLNAEEVTVAPSPKT